MENKTSGGGIGIGTVVTIVFVILKLIGVIDWSWVWVLCPLWISLGLSIILFGVAVLLNVLCAHKRRKRLEKHFHNLW